MSGDMIVALITAVSGVVTSSGLWAFVRKQTSNHSARDKLMMGLAYEKIVTLGMGYIRRGYISKDEYEEYLKYFVEPYKAMGGNGVAERIASEVASLPFRTVQFSEIVIKGQTP
jgi:hypothetical protein